MNKQQVELIKQIAIKIDKNKYNLILTSRNYDLYLIDILTLLYKELVKLEGVK